MIIHKLKEILRPKPKYIPIAYPIGIENVLKGKVALIIGGNSGIGLSIAQAFEKAGCKVIIAGSNLEKLQIASAKCGSNVKTEVINIIDVENIDSRIKSAASLFEENRIDILVNSFGIHHNTGFETMRCEEYDRIMNINTRGVFFACQSFCNYLIENNLKGHVLNITSSSALRPAWGPYQMSKWAIRGFTLGLAKKMISHGIIVNAIAPGQTATPMLGRNEDDDLYCTSAISERYLLPGEIATWATFLVSDLGNMIVGDTLYVTGGSGLITSDN